MDNFYKRLKNSVKPFRRHLKLKIKYFHARLRRKRLNQITFVGITGSSAKTTTTQLAAAILGQFGSCQRSQGWNSLDSVVKMLLKTDRRYRYCVAELAADGPDTLDLPARVFKPDIAVLTLIGREHYSAYKDIEEIAAEKEKVVRAMPPEGTAVLNIDDPLVRLIGERCNRRVIWFGEGAGATLRLLEVRSRWPEPLILWVEFEGQTYEVPTQLHGVHMAIPVLASLCVAIAADVPLEKAISALTRVSPPDGRMQVVTGDDGVVFVRDDWKAPLWSMNAPLEFLREARAERKIAVIGTISDSSGDYGPKYKQLAKSYGEVADKVVFVGPHALRGLRKGKNKDDASVKGFLNIKNGSDFLRKELRKGDLVLVKGTNQQDHLVRLVLNRRKEVRCWEGQCGSLLFCDQCSRLFNPPLDTIFYEPVPLPSEAALPVVVGMGNPGARFYNTPHNVGYRVIDALALTMGGVWREQPDGLACTIDLSGTAVHLFKPGAWMNHSGPMVRRFLARIGSIPQQCVIVHDDMNLAFGNVRIKPDGGDAGHKGMRSVLAEFDTESICRIRIGVKPANDQRNVKQFVLSKFSKTQGITLAQMIETATEMLMAHLENKINCEAGKAGSGDTGISGK